MTDGKTGIEIHIGLSPAQKKIGAIFHSLHLDTITKWFASNASAVMSVDGVEHVETLFQHHFLEAAPGAHHVSIFVRQAGAIDALAKQTTGVAADVTVNPGMVTVLNYRTRDTGGADLEAEGERPA